MHLNHILKYTKLSLKLSLLVLLSGNFQYTLIKSNSTTPYDKFYLKNPKLTSNANYFSLPTQEGWDSIIIFERDDPYNITLRINLTRGEEFIIGYISERYDLLGKIGNSTQENIYNLIALSISIRLSIIRDPIEGFYTLDVGEKVEAIQQEEYLEFFLILDYLLPLVIIVFIGLLGYLKFVKNRQRLNK